ncbi:MAG: tyrosine-type recombinase/integrase [Chloroflexia bacterium]|nr:tyrosine-type recombinase/integrase [Chloroflexia bacterium]
MKGSIQKRVGKRGTMWYGKYDVLDPATGKRVYRRVNAPTRKECEARLRAAIQAGERGQRITHERQTVRDYSERWLAAVEPTVRPATYRRYADMFRLHVLPAIGGIQLVKLAPLDLQRLYADRLKVGLSATTVHHMHAVIHRGLKQALRWGDVDRNVSEMVDPPRRTLPDVTTWDAKQTAAVLVVGDDTDLAALWRLALLTGMRRGELLGVMWEDLDLDRGTLAVRRTLSRGKGGTWELGQPKTASGRRAIALPASCVAALRKHRARQAEDRLRLGPLWQDHGFVFTNETGGPLHVNSLIHRFQKLIAAAAVPTIRFHDLRHTSATLLLAQGVHPKIVQERLGHADISMTLNRYSHVMPGMQRQAADTLDAALDAATIAAS